MGTRIIGTISGLLVFAALLFVQVQCDLDLPPSGSSITPTPTGSPDANTPAEDMVTQSFTASAAFTGINTVRVVNPNGNINVQLDSAIPNVRVSGVKSTLGPESTDATNRLNQITILAQPLTTNSPILQIEAVIPVGTGTVTERVDFEIAIPAAADLDLNTQNGNITLEGNTGVVVARTSNGNITITDNTGNLNVSTSNGNLELQNIVGSVTGTTTNGSITVVAQIPTLGTINLTDSSGPIELQVPSSTAANLTLNANNGTIDADLTGFFVTNLQQPNTSSLNATLNRGGGQIFASTSNSTITFSRSGFIP